jgi:hypothetical protein
MKKTCSTAQLGARDINLHGPEQALARFDAQLFGTFKMDLLAYIRHSLVSANNCPALSKLICRTKTDTRPVQRVSATQNNRTMDTRTPSQRCNPMHARSNVHFFKQTPKRQGFTLQRRPRVHDIQSIRGVELLVGKSLF